MAGRPETKQYWMDQLSEYWDSGFTIPEYCELKELSYESAQRWISQLKKERRRRSANSGQEKMSRFPNLGAWKNLDVSLTSVSGPLFDLNIHDIDFALSLLGLPRRMTAAKLAPFDSIFHSEWSYPDCSIRIEGGFMLPSTLPFRSAFSAVFDHAVLEYDSRIGNSITVSSEKECSNMDCSAPHSNYYEELDEFASAMIHGTAVQCTLQDGFNAVKTCYELKALLERNA